MKKIAFIIIGMLCIQYHSKAQNIVKRADDSETIFGNGERVGGFLEMGTRAGEVNGQAGLFVGGSIVAVFGSQLNVGLAGYGLTTKVDGDTYDKRNRKHAIDMGYGGLLIEPVIGSNRKIHFTVPILLGVGGVGLRRSHVYTSKSDSIKVEIDGWGGHDETDAFLVAEPGLMLEFNLLRNVRLSLGSTYRYVYDSNLTGIADEELSGFTGSFSLKLGWF